MTSKLEDFPNGQLKHYIWDEQVESPEVVAMQDEEFEIVEKIVSHTPNKLHVLLRVKSSSILSIKETLKVKPQQRCLMRTLGTTRSYMTI